MQAYQSMKIIFRQGLFSAVMTAFLITACSTPEESTRSTSNPDTSPQAERTDQLPASLLGTFDRTQEACAKTTTMSMLTLSPDKLDFYYGYADVNAVTSRAGGYDVEATFYQQEGAVEVVPTPAEYRIEPDAQGNGIQLEWVSEGLDPSSLVRCNKS